MSAAIESLSDVELERRAAFYREKWINIALSTEPVEPITATHALRTLYGSFELELPPDISFLDSPGVFTLPAPEFLDPIKRSFSYKINRAIDAIWHGVERHIFLLAEQAVRWDVINRADERTLSYVRSHVFARFQAFGSLRDPLPTLFPDGEFLGWLAFLDFFSGFIIGVDRLGPIFSMAQACGWTWMTESMATMSNRPIRISLDDQGYLHSGTGKAIEYRDGWGLYMWHGQFVPENIILQPNALTVDSALKEHHSGIRRAMIDRIGLEPFTRGRRPAQSTQQGKLYRRRIDDDEPLVIVEVTCPSTGNRYFLRIPPNIRTVDSAIAWSFGKDPSGYHPQIET